MQEQNFKNHLRFHPAYHFITVPLLFFLIVGSAVYLISTFYHEGPTWLAVMMLVAAIFLMVTVTLAREYSKKLQDRVIRMEENFRHYRLTGSPLSPELTLDQIIALRFASDDEFPALCARAAQEKLQPEQIKKAVQSWRADLLRV